MIIMIIWSISGNKRFRRHRQKTERGIQSLRVGKRTFEARKIKSIERRWEESGGREVEGDGGKTQETPKATSPGKRIEKGIE